MVIQSILHAVPRSIVWFAPLLLSLSAHRDEQLLREVVEDVQPQRGSLSLSLFLSLSLSLSSCLRVALQS